MRTLRNWWPIILFGSLLIFVGCGGNGSGTAPANPAKAKARTLVVAGDQSVAGGTNYALYALMLAAPSTAPAIPGATTSSTFVPSLALYRATPKVVGNSLVTSFYSDQANTKLAGTLSETVPSETSFSNKYKSYPVTVNTAVNITGGNLPGSGNLVTIFTDSTGANTMTGSYTLKQNGITISLNLSKSSAGVVGGTITMKIGTATATVSQLTGSLAGGLTGKVTETPDGFTGTATLYILTGQYKIQLNIGGGITVAASSASNGELTITYGDGTSEKIANPLTTNLGTGSTTGGTSGGNTTTSGTTATTGSTTATTGSTTATTGSTTSGTTGSTGNPVMIGISLQVVDGVSSTESLCGHYVNLSNSTQTPLYWPKRTSSSPTNLPMPSNASSASALSINSKGEIVGSATDKNTSAISAIYWKTPTSVPVALSNFQNSTRFQGMSINDSSKIVGTAFNSSGNAEAIYWSNPTATPVSLLNTNDYFSSMHINNANMICGNAINVAYFWSSPTATPRKLLGPGNLAVTTNVQMNIHGSVVGSDGISSYEWAAPSYSPITLKIPAGTNTLALTINDKGTIFGADQTDAVPVKWASATSTPVSITKAAGYFSVEAAFNDDWFISTGSGQASLLYLWPKG